MKLSVFSFLFLLPALLFAQYLPGNDQDTNITSNQLIIKFVDQHMGKKVGRGQCWDLASNALKYAGAKWSTPYNFGRLMDIKKEAIQEGDIIQFKNVVIKEQTAKGTVTLEMKQHTAIVYKVLSNQRIEIAEQNTSYNGKKVSTSILNLGAVKRGSIRFYRPQN